jgi:hypothetical protein
MPSQVVIQEVAAARAMVATQKTWVGHSIQWVPNSARTPGFKFQAALALPSGVQPAGLFVACYFKHARILGANDKLYLSLFYSNKRIHGMDDNAPTRHRNDVGVTEQFYGARIDHPHRHRICDDAVEGYAEPIDPLSQTAMWTAFLTECNIVGAPPLAAPPPTQTVFNI